MSAGDDFIEFERRLATLRAETPMDRLVWITFPSDRLPGRLHAYGACSRGVGWVLPDGGWEWRAWGPGYDDEADAGEAESVKAAVALFDQRYAEALAAAPLPWTDEQKFEAYRTLLLDRAEGRADGRDETAADVVDAIETLEKCGWLDHMTPLVDETIINSLCDRLIVKLGAMDKLSPIP